MKLYIIIIFESGGQFSAEGGFIFVFTAGVQLGYPDDGQDCGTGSIGAKRL